jgi:hypothetical protein
MSIEEQLNTLQIQLETEPDFFIKMDILDKISDLKIQHGLKEKPDYSCNSEDGICLSCGS